MNQKRIDQLMKSMEQEQLPQLLLCDPHTIAYLTDDFIDPGERFLGLLLRRGQPPILFLNRLFAAAHIPADQTIYYDDTQRGAVLAASFTDSSVILGVDKNLRAEFLLELQEHNAASGYRNGSPAADRVRACKDEKEAERMRLASRLNDQAMELLKGEVRLGVSETELAQRLLEIYHEIGADGPSFPPIVSFGSNAADPHHEPDQTQLKPGDCVLFDIGCKKDGYCADMTRTYFFGEVQEEDRAIYELVRQANLAGEAAVAPGVRFCDIDHAARQVIEQGGYGPNFTHRLGHFIGQTDHEKGDVSGISKIVAQPGMIFSIEPGIYLTGDTGVRIEDLVLVTEDGCEVLNHYPKALEIL